MIYSVARVDHMNKNVEKFFTNFKDAFTVYLNTKELLQQTKKFNQTTLLFLSSYHEGDKKVLDDIKIDPKSEDIIYTYKFMED